MSAIKIVFFDIDGTLIDMNKKRISEKMLETLRRLKENGTIICIATGRSPIALPHFEGVEFDAFLTFNGSYCFTEDADIFSNPIPTEDVHMIIQNATALGRPLTVATKNRLASTARMRICANIILLPNRRLMWLMILSRLLMKKSIN